MKLRRIALTISVLLLLSVCACNGEREHSKPPAENYTEGLEYTLSLDGDSYLLSGAGEAAGRIVIPESYSGKPVSGVERFAFRKNEKVTEAVFPKSVKYIGESAFSACYNLRKISFSEGTELIERNAFSFCKALEEAEFPDTLKEVGVSSFEGCGSLKEISFKEGTVKIGQAAFKGCTSLSKAEAKGAVYLGTEAFCDCTALSTVELSEVKEIGAGAFLRCSSLKTLKSGDCLERIEADAFKQCTALVEIDFPVSLKYVGNSAFFGCDSLKTVRYSGSVGKWNSIIFDWSGNAPLAGAEIIYSAA